ncbi:MAG: hypothetical protein PHV57_07140 [Methanomicrobiaceae archaeon]|nr:hypothetical protein [Methanomicrobiaceae archaeon]
MGIKLDKSNSRRFDGERYYLYKRAVGKKNAENIAARLRQRGYPARVTKTLGWNTKGWSVWVYNVWAKV